MCTHFRVLCGCSTQLHCTWRANYLFGRHMYDLSNCNVKKSFTIKIWIVIYCFFIHLIWIEFVNMFSKTFILGLLKRVHIPVWKSCPLHSPGMVTSMGIPLLHYWNPFYTTGSHSCAFVIIHGKFAVGCFIIRGATTAPINNSFFLSR